MKILFQKLNNNIIVFVVLGIILLGACGVRLYRFNNPIADWHSWRQADTSAVSRNFVKNGFDILHPRFDDLSNVPSGLDNPQGYRFVEFPIFNVLQAGGFLLFHHVTLEEWGRLITIIASLTSTVFLFLIAKRHISRIGAVATAFFFAFLPFSIYYGRVILPDPSMVAATLGCVYFFDSYTLSNTKRMQFLWILLAICFGIAALLLKPYAAIFLLPTVVSAWKKWGVRFLLQPLVWGFFILCAIPLAVWREWMRAFPSGIPVSDWLFNGGNIRFTGAYFYWIFGERIGKLILGYWGLPLVLLAFLSKKQISYLLSFVAASLLYVSIIARGNVQHDYYQILILPTLALLFGQGIDTIFSLVKGGVNRIGAYSVAVVATVFMLMFGWYYVRDYFNINNPSIVAAGRAVDTLTPKNAKVIAPYDGDTSFLYQTNRRGWASFEKDLPVMIHMGADYLVLVNPSQADRDGFGKEYRVVASDPQYLLVDLHKKP